jgi:hypothetical protein
MVRPAAGEVEVGVVVGVAAQQLGGHGGDVARVDEAALGAAGGQEDGGGVADAGQPEGVEVLHEPVRPDHVERHAAGFKLQLGAAQRGARVGVGAHGRHQHQLVEALRARLLDQRAEQLVRVHVAGRGQQEGAVDALEGVLQALVGDEVELHLVGRGGRAAGGAAHGVAGGGQAGGELAADGAAGADDEGGGHVRFLLQGLSMDGRYGQNLVPGMA